MIADVALAVPSTSRSAVFVRPYPATHRSRSDVVFEELKSRAPARAICAQVIVNYEATHPSRSDIVFKDLKSGASAADVAEKIEIVLEEDCAMSDHP